MPVTIDLNCDLGEGFPNDAELMRYISSANIACGAHAGDDDTIRRTVELALKHGVAIGAHPGYEDRANFGRSDAVLTPTEIVQLVTAQILKLKDICSEEGAAVRHVKPHGALYNQAARDREIACAIAEAIVKTDEDLSVYGLAGSLSISEAEVRGLRAANEVFADRTYASDGTLTPRSQADALITDVDTAVTQVLDIINYRRVRSTDAVMVRISGETVCLHGDGPHAVEFARSIHGRLTAAGVLIQPPFTRQ